MESQQLHQSQSHESQEPERLGGLSTGASHPIQAAADDSDEVKQLQAYQEAANQSDQVQEGLQLQANVNEGAPLQLYSENQVGAGGANANALSTVTAEARKADGFLSESKMHRNYAYDLDNTDLVTHSRANGHSEPQLLALSLSRQAKNDTKGGLKILTERKPCGECKSDIQKVEAESGQTIDVTYFVDYPQADLKDQKDLWNHYKTLNLTGANAAQAAAPAGAVQVTETKIPSSDARASNFADILAAARQGDGFLCMSKMHRNYAFNVDATDLVTHSKANGHSEPQLLSLTLARMQRNDDKSGTITILTERKPCGGCKSDLDRIAAESGKALQIYYLVDYPPAAANKDQEDLWKFYTDQGKVSGEKAKKRRKIDPEGL